jgi:hypothetical protein
MNNSRLVAHALGIMMAAVLLSACSSGSGFVSSTTPLTSQGVSNLNARGGAAPAEKLCKPIVYVGVGWQYEPYYNQYWEYTGPWTYGAYGVLVPCAGDLVINKTTRIIFPWWGGISAATNWAGVKAAFAVSEATSSAVAIVTSSAKATKLYETLDLTPYAVAGVAVSSKGTLYVSVVPPSSGSLTSCIVVYPKGSTTSSGMLSDSRMAQSAGAIAVDKAGDVFVSYPVSGSGSQSLQIDVFRREQGGKATSFASISGASVGALAITKSGDVVASAVTAGSSNLINVYSPKGTILSKFSVSGDPTSLSLNNKDTQLDVVDSINNLVSVYSFPSGTLVSQSSLGTASEAWTPAGVAQP